MLISLDAPHDKQLSPLTTSECQQLAAAETVIESGLKTFWQVGEALAVVRDGKLYKGTHGTFEDYCREKWRISKTHANRLIDSFGVSEALAPIGVKPQSESQVRPLTSLKDASAKKINPPQNPPLFAGL